jgi:hypothetical protein
MVLRELNYLVAKCQCPQCTGARFTQLARLGSRSERIVAICALNRVACVSEFMQLDAKAPAAFGAVLEAVTRLSTLSEAKILELASAGKIADLFPFTRAGDQPIPSDTMAEEELVEASAFPLNRKQRDALIQSSLPASSPKKYRRGTLPKR